MVAGAYPIVKLAALAIRQISKPLANKLKARAKTSHFFRTYVCMPPAQIYHWVEINIKMRLLNLGKPSEVQKLNENMAIELGAELLGEAIIFITAATTLTAEYIRSSRKERDKEAAKDQRFQELEDLVIELKYQLLEQEAELKHVNRMVYAAHQELNTSGKNNSSPAATSAPANANSDTEKNGSANLIEKTVCDPKNGSANLIEKAIDDAKKSIKG